MGSVKVSNINHIQRFQSKTLRAITKALIHVFNQFLLNSFVKPPVHGLAYIVYRQFNLIPKNHPNL